MTWAICKGRLKGICQRVVEILANAHLTSFSLWYGYLVTASVALQANWTAMEEYVPTTWRHRIIIAATIILFLDKLRRAAKATKPPQ